MKKIDVFIIQTFLRSFIGVFFIASMILILQMFWLYLDELTGKGLEPLDVMQFTSYIALLSVGEALPISILAGCIMTYGSLGEKSEIVAMTSSGLSFGRIARPVSMVAVLFVIIAFIFQNFINPFSMLKLTSMRYDMVSSKPAFALNEGVFYTDIDGFVILVDKKYPDDKHIEDIIIYQVNSSVQDHLTIGKRGIMYQPQNRKDYLRFILDDGYSYQKNEGEKEQWIKLSFDKYIKDFPLWQFKNTGSDSLFTYSYNTQGIYFLTKQLDEIEASRQEDLKNIDRVYEQFFPLITWLKKTQKIKKNNPKDGFKLPASYKERLNSDDNKRNVAIQFNQFMSQVESYKINLIYAEKREREAIIEINKKLVKSFICIIFFLLGSSLGTLTKRGSLGLPLAISTAVFVAFYFSNIFVEKWCKDVAGPNPYITPWLNIIIFFTVGIILYMKISGVGFAFGRRK